VEKGKRKVMGSIVQVILDKLGYESLGKDKIIRYLTAQ